MKFGEIKKIMLLGGSYLIVNIYDILLKSGYEIIVITSERHLNEHIKHIDKTLKEFFEDKKINFFVKSKIDAGDNEIVGIIDEEMLAISVSAPWIFKKDFIDKFKGRFVNLHGTRLPQDRGGGNYSWRILRDERLGFAAIHKMDAGIDTGDLVKYVEYVYPPSCRLPIDFEAYSSKKYVELFKGFIEDIKQNNEFFELSQPEYLSSYWPRLFTDRHGYINWDWKLKHIEQFICAFDEPYDGATTFINGQKVRIRECYSTVSDGIFHPFQNGLIYKKSNSVVFVATEYGAIIVKKVLDEEKKNIIENLKVGDRFYTPREYLERAKQFRAIFTPDGLKNDK